MKTWLFFFTLLTILFLAPKDSKSQCFDCLDSEVLTYHVDLSATPDTIWVTPTSVARNGTCCAATEPPCIRFIVKINPMADEFSFQMADGATPPGMEYMVNCTDTFAAGTPICVPSADSLCILYCKPGGNKNRYQITTARNVYASPDITLAMGCTGTLSIEGVQESSITWNSIFPDPDGLYNSYLSCISGCDTTYVTAAAGYPPYVDFVGQGIPTGCSSSSSSDTVRVFFVSGMTVNITPENPAICFGGSNVTLTANVTGGAPPYSYQWSNSATTPSVSVGVGSVSVTVTDGTTGCPGATDTETVIAHPSAITANAGADAMVCISSPAYTLNGSVTVATGGIWSGGAGSYNPNNTTLNAIYTPSAGEISAGSVTLTLTTTGNGGCPEVTDNILIQILPAPVVNAGADQVVCATTPSTTLNGSVTVGSTTGIWSSSGTGSFTPNATTLNATYNPSAADISAGTVNLTLTSTGGCSAVTDNMVISILATPIVSAGADQTVCANNAVVTLNGSVTGGATAGQWSSSGTGTFSLLIAMNATYTPSPADTAAGTVTITLSSTDGCSVVTDNMVITITNAPYVNAGVDQTVCGVGATVVLNGTIYGGSTTGIWTSTGTGSFTPGATTIDATYTPSAADITAGTVTLTLTSTANGTCTAVNDAMIVTITPTPIVNAGINQTVCSNNAVVTLNGSISGGATAGQWSSSGTGSFSSLTAMNATYTPSSADTAAGVITITLSSTDGCAVITDNMTITYSNAPYVLAGPDQIVCQSTPTTVLNGTVGGGSTTGIWTSTGTGTFTPGATTIDATYNPSAADITAGSVTLTLTSTANGTCIAVADAMLLTISPAPVVNAGADQVVCATTPSTTLNGSVTVGSTTGIWSSSGTGSFTPNATTLNATYNPSAADITAGTVTLTLTATGGCYPETDQMIVTITPAPIVNAGVDRTVCANNAVVTLNGSVTGGATAGQWSSSGTGSFSSLTAMNATYTPSSADTAVGTVTITLSSTDGCAVVTDNMVITITNAPYVNAGVDQTVCGVGATVVLNGTIYGGSTTGIWTSTGTGSFTPGATTIDATYTPSAADITAGTVTLTLTSTANGTCTAVNDAMIVTITPTPIVNAGINQTVCSNNAVVTLNGSISGGATAGQWSSSGTGSFSSMTAMNATYTPSTADTAAGIITITLSSTDGCAVVTDNMTITYTNAPYVLAGPDQIVCQSTPTTVLNGTIGGGSTTGIWTSTGTGSFTPGATTIDATYNPSAADITAGSVTLTLTSTANGTCIAVADAMIITITSAPVVNAGTNQTVCAVTPNVTLSGSVTIGATTGNWTSSGTGSFTPSSADLNATYTPSAADITVGTVTLTLTATGGCYPETDQIVITITPSPIVNAGIDRTVCANNAVVTLNGSVTGGATVGQWSSSGTGSFSSLTAMNATYTPSSADTAVGTVTISLSSTDGCAVVTDNMVITITNAPYVNAGVDQTVCGVGATVVLNGTIYGGSTTGIWTSTGTGSFTPGATTIDATYTPSAADITVGTVTFTLTSTANGTCIAVNDAMIITITPPPIVNAGVNQTICSNNPVVNLSGSVTGGGSTGNWFSSGTGTFSPSTTALNATYTPSNADTASGTVTLTLFSTDGCGVVTDNMVITITNAPYVLAGTDQIVCQSSPAVTLNGTVTAGSTTGIWTSTGTGSFTPGATTIDATYNPSAADITVGTVTLTLTSTSNGNCLAVNDQMSITILPTPVVDAGSNQTVCASSPNVSLIGSVTVGSTTGNWTSSGTGTFSPNSTTLNATYVPSAADISAGNVSLTLTATGGCSSPTDLITVTITPLPVVSAGIDRTICETTASINLAGSVTVGGTTGNWTSSGTGSFAPSSTILNGTYSPSAADIVAGNITLTLTSTNGCDVVSDFMILHIITQADVNAGIDLTYCSNNAIVNLSGIVNGAAGTGNWTTSGTGSFLPNSTTLNATYLPSDADTANGTVTLTLTSTSNGPCPADVDNLILTLTPSPYSIAGTDIFVCANNADAALDGSVWGASSTGIWTSSGTGSFSPSSSDLDAAYTPSAVDIIAGIVTLTLTPTGIGSCLSVNDQLLLTITPAPTADAGDDIYLCNTDVASLNGGIILGAGTGIWSSSGTGTFSPLNTDLNATYTPGSADTLAGSVTLTLTSTNNGGCLAVSDELDIIFTPRPIVDAGADQIICANNTAVLNGSVSGSSTTGHWITSGTGVFMPSDTALNPTYIPSDEDGVAGTVTLTLHATYACYQSDNLVVTLMTPPTVVVGSDIEICETQASVNVSGTVSGVTTTGVWTTSGNGTFTPLTTSLNPTYTFSAEDITSGNVTLYLTSTVNGDCLSETDSLIVTMDRMAIVDAGADITTCANNAEVLINGSVSGGSTTGNWTSSGSGSFSPVSNINASEYIVTDADTTAGLVTLTLSSTNNGSCPVVSDQLIVNITPSPWLNAGTDLTICGNNAIANLNGLVGAGATGGVWNTLGAGTFSPDENSLNADYIASTTDTISGNVILILTTTGNGDCLAVTDTLEITITDQPLVEAGDNQIICYSQNAIVEGIINVAASGAIWTTSGDGTFILDTDLSTEYTPGVNDESNGTVTLYLTTTGVGNCIPVVDSIEIEITSQPVVDAGIDETICSNLTLSLNGSVLGSSTTGIWSTSGTGIFMPDNTSLNAVYYPSVADTTSGSVILTLSATNSCVSEDQMALTLTDAPFVNAGIDQIICADVETVTLSGNVSGATLTGQWSTLGTGNFSPDATDLNALYNVSSADSLAGFVELILESTNNGTCAVEYDTLIVTITDIPVVEAGEDQTVCATNSVSLSGSITGIVTTGVWTSSGTGIFTPNATALNAVYHLSAADTAAGTVVLTLSSTGSCTVISDNLNVTITPAPFVNAGPDLTVCSNNANALLSGSVWGATTTGIWSTSGTGIFSPSSTDLNAVYMPSDLDTASGIVNLTLTSTSNGDCIAGNDMLVLTISNAPMVLAGDDDVICSGDNYTLSGVIYSSSGEGEWTTSGDGTFMPSANELNAVYEPGLGDNAAGFVILTLTSINIGTCNAVNDEITLSITPRPNVDAGEDQIICSNNTVFLLGSVTGSSTTGYWESSGTGYFVPDSTDFTAEYVPSAEDTASGSVFFTLHSTNSCDATDDMLLTLTVGPHVDAGDDQVICVSENSVSLEGSIWGATTTGIWLTSGTGYFTPDFTELNGEYHISAADSAAGTVQLVLVSTNNGDCLIETDTIVIGITDIPVVDAGTDQVVCANNDVQLAGSVAGVVTSGVWTTSGTGYFEPDSAQMDAVYVLSTADTAAGYVQLSLTSVGSCVDVIDVMDITITPAPFVNAGPNVIVCANNPNAVLSGNIWGATTTGIWSSSGSGTFVPSSTDLNVTYIPSNADTTAGGVTITLTATGIGDCSPVSDVLVITYTNPPIANAGNNIYACNDNNVNLSGEILFGAGTGTWTTTGAGGFVNVDSLNSYYITSPSDTVVGSILMILTSTNNGGCIGDSDTLTVYYTPRPFVESGADMEICSNDTLSISGIVSGSSTTGFWSSSGSGIFLPDSSYLAAQYVPSLADADTGFVYITLTSTNACSTEDSFRLDFIYAPVANAGSNQSVCPGDNMVSLSGSVTGVDSSGVWTTSGTGAFVPSDTVMNPIYVLSVLDIENGGVNIYLTSTGSGACGTSIDTMHVSVLGLPENFAGDDFFACGNSDASLVGTASDTTSYWETLGSGLFLPDSSALNGYYSFSTADTIAGFVNIVLHTSNVCGSVEDTVLITITPAPWVDAGTDRIICNTYTEIELSGIVTAGATTGMWTTSGDGSFSPSDSDFNAVYFVGSVDTTVGSVTLYLTSTGNGDCNAVMDSLVISILPAPEVYAGEDFSVCNTVYAGIEGIVNSASGTGTWSTTGDGSFSPSADSLSSTYNAGDADILAGEVNLVLIATNLGECLTNTDTVMVTFIGSESDVEIDDSVFICFGDSIMITPVVSGDTGTFYWTTGGAGFFWPNDSTANVVYNPDSTDMDTSNLYIYMEYHYVCGTINDSMKYTVYYNPDAQIYSAPDCKSMNIHFADSSTVNGGYIIEWEWMTGDGNSSADSSFNHEYADIGDFDISLVATSDKGCRDTVTSIVSVWTPTIAGFSVEDTIVISGQVIEFTDESTGAVSWYWTFGDQTGTSDEQNPVYSYGIPANYNVWQFIEAQNGCTDSTSMTFVIINNGYAVPSAFSPNGDNLNDFFFIRGGPFSEYDLRVFNSWGQQIFISTDQNVQWDGTFRGKDQPEGVYIYTFKGRTIDGDMIDQTGDITIIR